MYVFKHALTQDVAYESLITTQRRALHRAAGQALEVLYADRLEEAYDRLAHHYARTDDAGKAVAYLTRFAEKAARSYANAEAVTALQEALGHVERLPAAERDHRILNIVILLSHSLILLGRFQNTLEILLQQQARVEQLQEPALAGPYYFWCAHTYSYMGDQERAAQSAQRAIEEGRRCGDDVTMGKRVITCWRGGVSGLDNTCTGSSTANKLCPSWSGRRSGGGSASRTGRWPTIITSWEHSPGRWRLRRRPMPSEKRSGIPVSRATRHI